MPLFLASMGLSGTPGRRLLAALSRVPSFLVYQLLAQEAVTGWTDLIQY